ncbi:hypothetical protein pSalSNUABM01_157 [Salmonella phage pSal-SNUABM-01]|nr:hypothetical protein pSalSNUABM01_157 [Salmonella phage pSal-SNUABM-01]
MNMPSREEQDRIIADMVKAQQNLLSKPTKAQRQRQQRIEAEQRATEETVTYVRKVPAPTRQQSVQTTVTAAPRLQPTNHNHSDNGFMTFHDRVAANFGNKCPVTGHSIRECLQVAMIRPTGSDATSNGILFDTVLRIMFERGMASVNPDTMTLHFSCNHPYAGLYEGVELTGNRVKLDMEALRIHWNLFRG